jgi:hypothetical protein
MTPQTHLPPQDDKSPARRARAVRGLLLLILVLTPLGVYLYQNRPNLYDRARSDLMEASRSLDTFSQDLEQLARKEREGAEALKSTLQWLGDAAASDPADQSEIAAISAALQDWEVEVHEGKLSASELRDRYRVLETRVQRLIDKRTGTGQPH